MAENNKDLLKSLLDKREDYQNIINFMNCAPFAEDITIIIKKNVFSYSEVFSAKKKMKIPARALREIVFELIKNAEEKIDVLIKK